MIGIGTLVLYWALSPSRSLLWTNTMLSNKKKLSGQLSVPREEATGMHGPEARPDLDKSIWGGAIAPEFWHHHTPRRRPDVVIIVLRAYLEDVQTLHSSPQTLPRPSPCPPPRSHGPSCRDALSWGCCSLQRWHRQQFQMNSGLKTVQASLWPTPWLLLLLQRSWQLQNRIPYSSMCTMYSSRVSREQLPPCAKQCKGTRQGDLDPKLWIKTAAMSSSRRAYSPL